MAQGLLRLAASMPWAIQESKLDAILDVLEMHDAGLRFTSDEIRAAVGDGMRGAPSASRAGSVAVLPLYGVIAQRMNMMTDVSGGTSTELFGKQLEALVADPNVSAVVLDVDSPGGTTAGVPELAARIRALRESKPIVAVANGIMCSAAYYLASQCTEVVAVPSAEGVGNIGVFMIHTDVSDAEAKDGVKRTIIKAGKYKAEATPYEPLTAEARAHLQERVDEMYGMFVRDVAKGRGVSASDVRDGYGEGRALSAKAALAAGLVDRIATMEETIARWSKPQRSSAALRATAGPPSWTESFTTYPKAAAMGGFLVSGSSLSAAGGADGVVFEFPSIPAPAPKAKEHPVSDLHTAATGAAPNPDLETLRAEMARREAITKLATLGNASVSDVDAAVASGMSAEDFRKQLVAKAVKPTPTPAVPGIAVGNDRAGDANFASLGEQLQAIAAFSTGGGLDPRLMRIQAAVSGASANVPSDGAFLIQQDFAVELTKDAFGEGSIAADCSRTEVSGNSDGLRVAYIDETSRATGSRWGGVRIYRGAEADSATAQKPKIGEWEQRVYDLIGAAYMTERLLQDAPAMQSVFQEAFQSEYAFVVDDEIVRGTGVGQCLGVLNSSALVTVAKESGQVADTVVAENLQKMWSRLLPRAKATAVWYINQELEQQLQNMQIGTGTSGQLVYMPPGGMTEAPYGRIYGRPVKVVEQCSAPGDVGDVILASMSGYKLITKGGLQSDDSIHVRFLNNERTFRWISRVGGAPKMKSAITPYKGTLTLSDHVTLAAR